MVSSVSRSHWAPCPGCSLIAAHAGDAEAVRAGRSDRQEKDRRGRQVAGRRRVDIPVILAKEGVDDVALDQGRGRHRFQEEQIATQRRLVLRLAEQRVQLVGRPFQDPLGITATDSLEGRDRHDGKTVNGVQSNAAAQQRIGSQTDDNAPLRPGPEDDGAQVFRKLFPAAAIAVEQPLWGVKSGTRALRSPSSRSSWTWPRLSPKARYFSSSNPKCSHCPSASSDSLVSRGSGYGVGQGQLCGIFHGQFIGLPPESGAGR